MHAKDSVADFLKIAADYAREAANKVLGQQTSDLDHAQFEASRRRGEHDPSLCIVCQVEPCGLEDDTCSSRVCREEWFSEFFDRL